jgi:hypothetical protein
MNLPAETMARQAIACRAFYYPAVETALRRSDAGADGMFVARLPLEKGLNGISCVASS